MNNEYSSPRNYKRYDENFKRCAMELWLQGGKSVAQICREPDSSAEMNCAQGRCSIKR